MNIIPRFGKNVKFGLFNLTKKYTTPSTTPSNPPPTNPSVTPSFNSNIKYPLTNTRKILCVWAKRYPSLKDVPDHVTPEVWNKVRSIVRIKVANYTMFFIILGCIAMIITGKRARDRGETIMQRNLDWHQKYSEGKEDIKNIGVFGK
ncbi:UPF0389 protein CG9231 [Aphis gossypii]|uniref:Uncharacterized protein n=1 Tax=Aphis gossypii TaxID=80765 RepID=A0A9P0J286_APHGO|nr:UPF0389 protein CG9231 [Aphis gossypii]CAH1724418.1 unnamed protein product [Aphis gossypii]